MGRRRRCHPVTVRPPTDVDRARLARLTLHLTDRQIRGASRGDARGVRDLQRRVHAPFDGRGRGTRRRAPAVPRGGRLGEGGRPVGVQVRSGRPSTTSSRSTRTCRRTSRFLGYCAAITERIHLGSGIFNVTPPVNHPARIAERAATLDHLSEGRFEMGMGRGSSTTEQRGFGIDDPELTRAMFDEAVPEIVKMWHDGRVPRVRRSVLLDAAPQRPARSRTRCRTRRCGSRPAARPRSRRRLAWASASCASRPVPSSRWPR